MLLKKGVKDDLVELEKPRKKSKRAKFQFSKKMLIPVVAVLLLVVVFGVKSAFFSNMDYVKSMQSILATELGSFHYVFSINTGDAGTVLKEDLPAPDISEVESGEGASGDTQNTQKYEFADWDKYADVKSGNWKYPVYQIIVDGRTTSIDPLVTSFTVSIATPYASDLFTEVTCFDGNYYIDIEQMRSWLMNSKDSVLISFSEGFPQGSKYLVIPEAEFKIPSRYAESGERSFSEVQGLTNLYRRFIAHMKSLSSRIADVAGGKCFKGDKTSATMEIGSEQGKKILSDINGLVSRIDSYEASLVTDELYSDAQKQQFDRERDNILDAFFPVMTKLSSTEDANLQMNGYVRKFEDSVDGNMAIALTLDGVDYDIKFSGVRSTKMDEIVLPSGSQLTLETLEGLGNRDIVLDTIWNVLDYFNFTEIKTFSQLEMTPDRITENAIEDFISLVNESGVYEEWLTKYNVYDYLEMYMNPDQSGATDPVNTKLVADFIKSLNDITGGLVVEKVVEAEEEVEKYPDLSFSEQGIDFTLKYNEELSKTNFIVLDGEAINKDTDGVTVDLTMFSLHTLLSSVYPANNETLILGYDNEFDFESLQTSLDLPAGQWGNFRLYFVISDDGGHMDLFLGDLQKGAVVEY